MSYRAQWTLADGTPAPGPDLGEVKPGQTGSVTRMLRNTGTLPLSAVQFTLVDDLPGVSITVNDTPLTPGEMYAAPGLEPNAAHTVTYSRTVPSDADPGPWRAFLRVRGLT